MKKFMIICIFLSICGYTFADTGTLDVEFREELTELETRVLLIENNQDNYQNLIAETYSISYGSIRDSYSNFLQWFTIILIILGFVGGFIGFFGIRDINKLKEEYNILLGKAKKLYGSMEGSYKEWEDKTARIEKATPEEIKEKQEEDVGEEKDGLVTKDAQVGGISRHPNREAIIAMEKLCINTLTSLFLFEEKNLILKEGYKISNENGDFIADAIVLGSRGNIQFGIEIKYILNQRMPLSFATKRALAAIRYYQFDFPFLIVLIYTDSDLNSEDIEQKYGDSKVLVMNYDSKKKALSPINNINLSDLVPTLSIGDYVVHKFFGHGKIVGIQGDFALVKFNEEKRGIRRVAISLLKYHELPF